MLKQALQHLPAFNHFAMMNYNSMQKAQRNKLTLSWRGSSSFWQRNPPLPQLQGSQMQGLHTQLFILQEAKPWYILANKPGLQGNWMDVRRLWSKTAWVANWSQVCSSVSQLDLLETMQHSIGGNWGYVLDKLERVTKLVSQRSIDMSRW